MNYDPIAFLAQSKLKDLGFYKLIPDGLWGPNSVNAINAWSTSVNTTAVLQPSITTAPTLDSRTISIIATLDPKAQQKMRNFMLLAIPVAVSFGCEYRFISGYRTWAEQTVLYNAYKNGGPRAVPAGYSMHNLKLACDAGVFRNGKYLEDGNAADQALAEKVHLACSKLAAQCGLVAGATWTGKSLDEPHYQIDIGHETPTDEDRAKFAATGTIL